MSDTPTPRTDEFYYDPNNSDAIKLSLIDFARQLMRELTHAIEQRDRAMRLIGNAKPAWTDSERKDECFHQENVLMAEITKEKEAK